MNSHWGGPHHGSMTDVNIWDRILSENELSDWMFCIAETGGNVVSWESAQLNITGLNTHFVKREETCPLPQNITHNIVFNQNFNFFESVKLCNKLGGQIAVASDEEAAKLMNQTFAETCEGGTSFFTGYTDSEVEGQWQDVNSGDPLTWNNWLAGQPDGGRTEQCSMIAVCDGEIRDWICASWTCPICRVKEGSKLQLSGVCSESNIDRFYLIKPPSQLLGMTFTKIILSPRKKRWEIVDRHNEEKIFAFTKALNPLGKQKWYFEELNSCGEIYLNLHREVKKPGHFCCEDGACIDSELVCNNFPDCEDATDEANCSFLVEPGAGYKNHLPSIRIEKGKKILLSINATLTVQDIFEINEEQSFIDILLKFKLEWFDNSLTFKFLREERNELDEKSVKKIWKPEIILEVVKTDTKKKKEEISISKRTKPTLALNEVEEIYSGSENSLNLQQRSRMVFVCNFDSTFYPFGRAANCKIDFYLHGVSNSLTQLQPRLIDKGPVAFGQYLVDQWTIETEVDKSVGKIVAIRLFLSRKFRSIFMVTYLPTILMNIVNQATNYIRMTNNDDKYSLIYSINITCMMVLASVYLSVSASLPSTANIKPVEVWLLFNLAFPLLVILVNVLLQVRSKLMKLIPVQVTDWVS